MRGIAIAAGGRIDELPENRASASAAAAAASAAAQRAGQGPSASMVERHAAEMLHLASAADALPPPQPRPVSPFAG
jgi:hypothetical protein